MPLKRAFACNSWQRLGSSKPQQTEDTPLTNKALIIIIFDDVCGDDLSFSKVPQAKNPNTTEFELFFNAYPACSALKSACTASVSVLVCVAIKDKSLRPQPPDRATRQKQ
jgi:hypothetical protein